MMEQARAGTGESMVSTTSKPAMADAPASVAAVYEKHAIARSYLDKRLQFSWQRFLHQRQVTALQQVIATYRPARALELAPGPARLAVHLTGVRGVMVENSEEMVAIARERLQSAGLADSWELRTGDAFQLEKVLGGQLFEFAYTFRFIRHFHRLERERLYEKLRAHIAERGLLMFDVVSSHVRALVLAKQGGQPAPGEIAIHDASYTAQSFAEEMDRNGFEVLSLEPVLQQFQIQSFISYKLDDVAAPLSAWLVRALERFPSAAPLEWVALCRKR